MRGKQTVALYFLCYCVKIRFHHLVKNAFTYVIHFHVEEKEKKKMSGNRNLLTICKFVIAQMRKATQASGPFVPANKARKFNRSVCEPVPLSSDMISNGNTLDILSSKKVTIVLISPYS